MTDETAATTPSAAPGPPPDPISERLGERTSSLRVTAARGTLVNAAYLVGIQVLTLVKAFAAAAFLSRRDYGVWGVLAVALGTLLYLKQVGIGDKYVQQEEADQELAFQKAFTLELGLNVAFALLLAAALPVLALVYGQAAIVAPGLVFLLAVPAAALQAPTWVFYRRMDYRRQRALGAVDPLVSFAVTVALAVAGAGYWSLVGGAVAGAWIGGAVAVWKSPYPVRLRYDRGTLRSYWSFSWPLFATTLSSLLIAQSSILVGEQTLGLAGVGIITLAATVTQYTNGVDVILSNTIYPAICAVRDRRDLLFESFSKSNRLALLWGMPFGVGVSLFAADLVAYVLGAKWRPAVGLLEAFGVMAAFNHVAFNFDAYFRARGETRPVALVAVLSTAAFLLTAIPLLITHGLGGFALGMGIMTAINLVARTLLLTRIFPGFQMLAHAARAIVPTIPAAAAVLAVRALSGGDRSPGLAVAELALYAVLIVLGSAVVERPLLREMAGYLRGRARPAPTAA